MKILITLFIFYLLSILAYADNNESFFSKVYFGAEMDMDFLIGSKTKNLGLIGNGVKVGYEINNIYSLEVKLGSSMFDSGKNRVDNSLSLSGKYSIDMVKLDMFDIEEHKASLYALFGLSSSTTSSENSEKSYHTLSPSFGVGVEYPLANDLSLYGGYEFLSVDFSQINFGINYYFNKSDIIDFKEDQIQQLALKERLKEEKPVDKDVDDNRSRLQLKLLHKEETKKPIFAYLYELSSVDAFKRLDYEETIALKKGALDGAVLGMVKLILKPAKMESFNIILKDETRYFALVAAISDEKSIDEWRFIKETTPNKTTKINLMLNHNNIMEFNDD